MLKTGNAFCAMWSLSLKMTVQRCKWQLPCRAQLADLPEYVGCVLCMHLACHMKCDCQWLPTRHVACKAAPAAMQNHHSTVLGLGSSIVVPVLQAMVHCGSTGIHTQLPASMRSSLLLRMKPLGRLHSLPGACNYNPPCIRAQGHASCAVQLLCPPRCAVESRARSAESAANEGDQQAQQVVPSWHKPPKYPPDNGGSPPSLISPPSGPPPGPTAPEQPCNAYNFNGPWISGDISTSITVFRTLTSVVSAREGRVTFTAQGSADAGSSFEVVVVPASFRTRGRQSQRVSITVRAKSDTPMGKHQFGQVGCRCGQSG